MTKALDFLIKKNVDESDILKCFDAFFDCKVSAVDRPNQECNFFLHCTDYSEGFRWAAFLSWSESAGEFDELSLARHIVSFLQTEVLFEPNAVKLPVPLTYIFMTVGGAVFAADYLELEDGIDVLSGSLVLV